MWVAFFTSSDEEHIFILLGIFQETELASEKNRLSIPSLPSKCFQKDENSLAVVMVDITKAIIYELF